MLSAVDLQRITLLRVTFNDPGNSPSRELLPMPLTRLRTDRFCEKLNSICVAHKARLLFETRDSERLHLFYSVSTDDLETFCKEARIEAARNWPGLDLETKWIDDHLLHVRFTFKGRKNWFQTDSPYVELVLSAWQIANPGVTEGLYSEFICRNQTTLQSLVDGRLSGLLGEGKKAALRKLLAEGYRLESAEAGIHSWQLDAIETNRRCPKE